MSRQWQVRGKRSISRICSRLARNLKSIARLPTCFAEKELVVAEGRPAEAILAQIRERAIDLAVLGSRAKGSLTRLLLGSTSEQVLREAPCSVLIIR